MSGASAATPGYEEFSTTIQKTLKDAERPLTWTEIRTRAGLRQKFPNNRWVHRMEEDIGLIREKSKDGKILWKLHEEMKD
jgi:hypothetical protein